MAITIELDKKIEKVVRAKAGAQGLDIKEYLRLLVQRATEAEPKCLSRAEFEREWALLSENSEGLPRLSNEDLSREALYADHD